MKRVTRLKGVMKYWNEYLATRKAPRSYRNK